MGGFNVLNQTICVTWAFFHSFFEISIFFIDFISFLLCLNISSMTIISWPKTQNYLIIILLRRSNQGLDPPDVIQTIKVEKSRCVFLRVFIMVFTCTVRNIIDLHVFLIQFVLFFTDVILYVQEFDCFILYSF